MPRRALFLVKLDLWVQEMQESNYPETTVRNYSTGARLAWDWGKAHGWEQDPKKIEPPNIRMYLDHLSKFSSATQAAYGTTLLLFLKWAGNQHLSKFKLRIRVEREKADWLTVEEMSAVLASAPSMQIRAVETMFAYTGLRLSELVSLRLRDLHEDHLVVRRGKGGKARNVYVTKNFWDAMRPYLEWRRAQPGEMLMVHPSGPGYHAGPYTASGIASAIQMHGKVLKRHLSPHTFRRSFGQHLHLAGMPDAEIQKLYGHASVDMTIRYLGLKDEHLASSMDKYQPRY